MHSECALFYRTLVWGSGICVCAFVLRWYGHKTSSTGLAKMILQGTVQGGRRRGRQKKRWEDNITEWTGLKLGEALRKAENREEWRTVVARSSLVPQRSNRLWDKWSEVKWFVLLCLVVVCNISCIRKWDACFVLTEKEIQEERKACDRSSISQRSSGHGDSGKETVKEDQLWRAGGPQIQGQTDHLMESIQKQGCWIRVYYQHVTACLTVNIKIWKQVCYFFFSVSFCM